MSKKNYNFEQLAKKGTSLSKAQQKSLKGGRGPVPKIIYTLHDAIDWTEIDIRSPRESLSHSGLASMDNNLGPVK